MQRVAQRPVELAAIGALKHHSQVVAIFPVFLRAKLGQVVKLRARKRIGYGNANIVRLRLAHHPDCALNIVPIFTGISELQEQANANPVRPEVPASLISLLHAQSFLHGVQHLLRTGFGAHPDLSAARISQRAHRPARHQVAARLHLEWDSRVQRCDCFSELQRPMDRQREDIVSEPDVVRRERALQKEHLFGHAPRGAKMIAVAVDRLRAPIAGIRTTPARYHVQREVAVRRNPGFPIGRRFDQIPGRKRQRIQVPHHISRWIDAKLACNRVAVSEPSDAARCFARIAQQMTGGLQQRDLDFTQDHEIRAIANVLDNVIGSIGAVHHHRQSRLFGRLAHGERQLAIASKAHLREEVEVILAQRYQTRPMLTQSLAERLIAVFERAVVQRHLEALAPQAGRSQKRLEGWIRLHLAHLLPVEVQMVAVR